MKANLTRYLGKVTAIVPKKGTLSTVRGCLDPLRGLPALPNNCIDHFITDPPFEPFVHAAGARMNQQKKGGKSVPAAMEALSFEAMDDPQRFAVAKEMVRTCRGWLIIFCSDEGVFPWRRALEAAGAKRRTTCIWSKTVAAPKKNGNGPAQAFECIITAWCGEGDSVWNAGGKYGVYPYPAITSSKDRKHETQKPLDLMKALVLDFTMPGQIICDPYSGSGQTGIACKALGRPFLGFEITKAMADEATKDISKTKEQTYVEQMFIAHRKTKERAYKGAPKRKYKKPPLTTQTKMDWA